ncbi:MAG: hypothetical protein KDD35_11030, partial [Bdellovibrionales bacterium]|nr:hypothetical protein [Bdellovibrionales bacterium]
SFRLHLYVKKMDGQIGVAEGTLFQKLDLNHQLLELEQKALLGKEETWKFPPLMSSSVAKDQEKKVKKVYPPLRDDFESSSLKIYQDLKQAVQAESKGEFNSAELFVIRERQILTLSSGFSEEELESKIYAEVCFSSRKGDTQLSEEFLVTRWGSHPEQLDFCQMCWESAQYAEASLNTHLPQSGNYRVLLHASILNTLLHDVLSQLYMRNNYFKLPFKPKDSLFIESFSGHPFVLKLDPLKDYCFGSKSYSSEGLWQKPEVLVQNNRIECNPCSSQISQYLEVQASSVEGTIVVEAENLVSKEKLLKQGEDVLEILQFSGLFTNQMDLTFSSEIRLARLHRASGGDSIYIKGGNLSGHFPSNFATVGWAGENVVDNQIGYSGAGNSYYGPEWALIEKVSVSS